MWVSRKLSSYKKQKSVSTDANITDYYDGKIVAQSSDEHRDIRVITPDGLSYCPTCNDDYVLLQTDNDTTILGKAMKDKELNAGEIMLYSGSGSITLKNDGRVLINGNVFVNGKQI